MPHIWTVACWYLECLVLQRLHTHKHAEDCSNVLEDFVCVVVVATHSSSIQMQPCIGMLCVASHLKQFHSFYCFSLVFVCLLLFFIPHWLLPKFLQHLLLVRRLLACFLAKQSDIFYLHRIDVCTVTDRVEFFSNLPWQ